MKQKVINISNLSPQNIFMLIISMVSKKYFLKDQNKDFLIFGTLNENSEKFKSILNIKRNKIHLNINSFSSDGNHFISTSITIYLSEESLHSCFRLLYYCFPDRNLFQVYINSKQVLKKVRSIMNPGLNIKDQISDIELKSLNKFLYRKIRYTMENCDLLYQNFSKLNFDGYFKVNGIYRIKVFIDEFKKNKQNIQNNDIENLLEFLRKNSDSKETRISREISFRKIVRQNIVLFRMFDSLFTEIDLNKTNDDILTTKSDFLKFIFSAINRIGGIDSLQQKILIRRIKEE